MELFSLKERIIWNTFPASSSIQAGAKQLHGASSVLSAGKVRSSEGLAWPKPPHLATSFRRHLQIIVQNQKVQIHHSPTLSSWVWYFLFWRFPWYLTHRLWNTSCFKWLEFIDPLINYLTSSWIIEKRVEPSPYVNTRLNFKKSSL